MIVVGGNFTNLGRFFAEVETHELESNGALEVNREDTNEGQLITCRCSGALEGPGDECSAFITALDKGPEEGVEILQCDLTHSHANAAESLALRTKRMLYGDSFEPEDDYEYVTTPSIRPVESLYDDSVDPELLDEFKRVLCIKRRPIPGATVGLVMQPAGYHPYPATNSLVPRSFAQGELNLQSEIIQSAGRYFCPFCPNMESGIKSTIATHMCRLHQERAVFVEGFYFVPCYVPCRKRASRDPMEAHYHCTCGMILANINALGRHRRGPCRHKKESEDEAEEVEEEPEDPNPLTASGRPKRRSTKNFSKFISKLKRGGLVSDFGEEFGKRRSTGATPSRKPRIKKEVKTELVEDDEELLTTVPSSYDPNKRVFVDSPSEWWVDSVQSFFWSMESDLVGYCRSAQDLSVVIEQLEKATGHYFALERSDRQYGKNVIPKSAKGFRILWEGLHGFGPEAKRAIEFDGIPFVIIATRVHKCTFGPPKGSERCGTCEPCLVSADCGICGPCKTRIASPDYKKLCEKRRCEKHEEYRAKNCGAKIHIKEILKFPQLQVSAKLTMPQSEAKLVAAFNSGVYTYERRFYAILPSSEDHKHLPDLDYQRPETEESELNNADENCEEVDDDISELSPDRRALIGSSTCEFCSTRYTSLEELAIHMAQSHTQALFTCQMCQQKFPRSLDLQDHTMRDHADVLGLLNEVEPTEKPLFHEMLLKCALCNGSQFVSGPKQLVTHYAGAHSGTCKVDTKEFANQEDFIAWKEGVESKAGFSWVRFDDTPEASTEPGSIDFYVCDKNGTTNATETELLSNPGRCCAFLVVNFPEAEGEKIFAEFCIEHVGHETEDGENQAISNEECRHAEFNTGGDCFSCALCEKKYSTLAGLTCHFKVVHPLCRLCGEASDDLPWHMAIVHPDLYLHHSEDIFCGSCEASFVDRKALVAHYAAEHGHEGATTEIRLFENIKDFIDWKKAAFERFLHGEAKAKCEGVVRLICRGWNANHGEPDMKPSKTLPKCPAFLNFYVNKTLKQISAEYCTFHCNHVPPPKNLGLPGSRIAGSSKRRASLRNEDDGDETIDGDGQRSKKYYKRRNIGRRTPGHKKETIQDRFPEVIDEDLLMEEEELPPDADPLNCISCNLQFDSLEDSRRHRKLEHTSTKCRYCNALFKRYGDLLQHQRISHPTQIRATPYGLMCSLCGQKLDAYDDLAFHYKDYHEIEDCEVEFTTFETAHDFYVWKVETERKFYSYFVKKRRTANEDQAAILFTCMTGWKEADRNKQRQCPSFIKATINRSTGQVSVAFCFYHMGHENTEHQYWVQVRKAIHGFRTFRHINRLRRPKELTDQNASMTVGGEEGTETTVRYEEEVSTTTPNDLTELDYQIRFYWDTIEDSMHKEGNSVLGIIDLPDDDDFGEGDEGERVCHVCRIAFRNRRAMVRHLKRMHDPEYVFKQGPKSIFRSKYSRPVRCLFCNMPMSPPAMKNLIQHYVNAHQQNIQMKIRMFRNEMEFHTWREAVSGNVFRRNKWYATQTGEKRMYYTCKFSGHLQNPPSGVTEGHCPAWIFAQGLANGNIQVTYCLYHIGHELNPDGTASDIPPRYPLGRAAFRPTLSQQRLRVIPGLIMGAHDESGTAILALENGYTQDAAVAVQAESDALARKEQQREDGVVVEGEVASGADQDEQPGPSTASTFSGQPQSLTTRKTRKTPGRWSARNRESGSKGLSARDAEGGGPDESDDSDFDDAEIIIEQTLHGVTPEDMARLKGLGAMSGQVFQQEEEPVLRQQINVLVRSVDGTEREVQLGLQDFPLVEKEGKKFYALDEATLIEAVGQVLAKEGLTLYEGDQLEILQ